MILIQRIVNGGDLALTERVVQRIVDPGLGQAESAGRIAIDGQVDLKTALLLIGIDIGQLRDMFQRLGQLRRPFVEIGQIVALQRELVLRIALPSA